jgi:hypothetical protein
MSAGNPHSLVSASAACNHTPREKQRQRPTLWRLLEPDPAHVPHHDAPVRAAARKDGLVVRGPRELEHLVLVVDERVQLLLETAYVPERNGLWR